MYTSECVLGTLYNELRTFPFCHAQSGHTHRANREEESATAAQEEEEEEEEQQQTANLNKHNK